VSHRTANGRELVLVMNTGAIALGTGPGNVKSEGFLDVIDAVTRTLVATIPLGLAGPFNQIAIDPSGRVAVTGASSERLLYAVDLAALDDPRLYPASDPPPRLDGTSPPFPDVRIFSAGNGFRIPARKNGADPSTCAGRTDVAFDNAGGQLFVTDFCDGTLSIVGVDLQGDPDVPVPGDRFQLLRVEPVLAPVKPESIDELRAPSLIRVRPGRPGVDFTTPDVYFVAGEPEGAVCGVRIDSPGP
jgi:DNA-binding beta-propeller fold protein YncE